MSDALATLENWAGAPSPDAVTAVRGVEANQMRSLLESVQLSDVVVEELVAHWDATRASPRWSSLLAALRESATRDRGDIDAPVLIVDDLDGPDPSGRLLFYYLFALEVAALRQWYERCGVPAEVGEATIAALARHGETYFLEHGTAGIDAGWWMLLILRGDILQFGSLKFHRVHLEVSTLSPSPWLDAAQRARRGEGYRRGDEALGIHIPARIDLSPGAVDASLAKAREVLSAVWPAASRRIATCQSWMLDERLPAALGEDSRVVQFQRRFELIEPFAEDVDDVVRFVFGRRDGDVRGLCAVNRLQRVVIDVLTSGRQWHDRTGFLVFDGT